jgi:hypothetical protein
MFTADKLGKGILLLVIFLLVYYNQAWTFQASTNSIDRMDIRVENGLLSQTPYHLFWFGQKDKTIKLHYNSLLGEQPLRLLALTKKEETVTMPPSSRLTYSLGKDYSGTVAAVIPPVQVDLNGDGRREKIQLSAKLDTLFAQGYHPPRTSFEDPRLPLEICYKGNRTILILFQNKPLSNQAVRLVSRRGFGLGLDQTVPTNTAGMLQLDDIRHLRTGINLTYVAGDQTRYIASYRLEGSTLFTRRYLEALTPVFKVLQWSLILVGLWIVGKGGYWRRARTLALAPERAAERLSECYGIVNVTK